MKQLITDQRVFFNTNATKPIAFRMEQLEKLKALIKGSQTELEDAIRLDYGKGPFETFLSELFLVHDEIDTAQGLLDLWRCAEPEVLELGDDVVDPPTTVLRVSWADPSRIGWPLARGPERGRQRQKRRRAQREAE